MDQNPRQLPEHLAVLLHPTPSGVAALLAAWEDLCAESQVRLLTALKQAHRSTPTYLTEKVLTKALDSPSSYIRYLAAKQLYATCDDDLKQRIEHDPAPLVRYCLLESELALFDETLADPDAFFALPHEARLAKVRRLRVGGCGKRIAELMSHAVDHKLHEGVVSELELYEILADYIHNPEFKADIDRDISCDMGELDALWRLTLKVPDELSCLLIEKLPAHFSENISYIPEDVLDSLVDGQLAILFYRRDVYLADRRKKTFFEKAEEWVRSAAVHYNFDFTYAEFNTILTKPKKKKLQDLRLLATNARDLSLCYYDALHEILKNIGYDYWWDDTDGLINRSELKLERLHDKHVRKMQLRELRLYELATEAVPWNTTAQGHLPSDELAFLAEHIVEGNTWETFIAFSEAWRCQRLQTQKLEHYLPWVSGLTKDDLPDDGPSDKDRLQEIQETTEFMKEQYAALTSALTTHFNRTERHLTSNVTNILREELVNVQFRLRQAEPIINAILPQLYALRGSGRRQQWISYILISLLVCLVLMRWL